MLWHTMIYDTSVIFHKKRKFECECAEHKRKCEYIKLFAAYWSFLAAKYWLLDSHWNDPNQLNVGKPIKEILFATHLMLFWTMIMMFLKQKFDIYLRVLVPTIKLLLKAAFWNSMLLKLQQNTNSYTEGNVAIVQLALA